MEKTLTNETAHATEAQTDCTKVVEMLDLIVDGEAAAADKQYFFNHLEECAPCFESYNKEQQLKQFLQQSIARKTVPANLVSTIKELIKTLPETV